MRRNAANNVAVRPEQPAKLGGDEAGKRRNRPRGDDGEQHLGDSRTCSAKPSFGVAHWTREQQRPQHQLCNTEDQQVTGVVLVQHGAPWMTRQAEKVAPPHPVATLHTRCNDSAPALAQTVAMTTYKVNRQD